MAVKRKILIVDDDSKSRKILCDILKAKGYLPISASKGKEAVGKFKEEIPAVALIDLKLGDMYGLEVMGEIKKHTSGTECIVLTGYASKDSAIQAVNLGAYSYFQKPYDVEQLLVTIRRAVEKYETEKKIRESEEFMHRLIDTNPNCIFVKERSGKYILANRALAELYEMTPDRMKGKTDLQFAEMFKLDLEKSKKFMADDLEVIEKKQPQFIAEELFTRPDGTTRWFQTKKVPLTLNDASDCMLGVAVDITERKRMEADLKKSEERYRLLVENAPLGIISVNTDGKIIDVNLPLLTMLSSPSKEVIKAVNIFTFPPLIEAGISEAFRKCLESEKLIVSEHPYISKERKRVHLRSHLTPIRDENNRITGVQGIIEDITDQKNLEEQLLHSQKMEAIGRLAGGIAHDFSNILTIITGYSELILNDLEQDNPIKNDIQEIKEAGKRASSLIEQLLAFSRKQVLQLKVLDFNALVINMEKMLGRLIGENIELVTVLGKNLGRIKADAGQIQQVILNLAINSKDAMPKGGKLTIETENIYIDEEYVEHHPEVTAGNYIVIIISDNGIGMDQETLFKIFEPFFTTKEKGKGTGLGLATVYGIVRQSGGFIFTYSEPDKGTTFKIYFPQLAEDFEKDRQELSSTTSLRGSETILLVEDEDNVRSFTKTMLNKYGYTVLEAKNGKNGLKIWQEYENEIHLLLADVIMPHMNGRELSELLTKQSPNMEVIFISGYTEQSSVLDGMLDEGINFLQKPFTAESLLLKIRKVLDENR